MNIRSKIVLVSLPLIITPLLLTAVVATLSARNGITMVATNFLQFKIETLIDYMNSQWTLLNENNMTDNKEFVNAAKIGIQGSAKNLLRNDTEAIFAMDKEGNLVMETRDLDVSPEERRSLKALFGEAFQGWRDIEVSGVSRVAQVSYFAPFGWYLFVTEERETFYGAVTQIIYRTGIILTVSLLLALTLLFIFSTFLTNPLKNIVDVIRDIIATNDLSKKVTLQYRDETGKLGHYFNLMTGELDKAYNQIKGYALQAVIAQNKEKKIRNIFQKYVPNDVIDQIYANPEGMLVGENRMLAILFSDIRSFTTISESLKPDELVQSLNKYFEQMVEIIMNRHGIVDKYIGDAIMAFFGAPAKRDDDPLNAVTAGIEMSEAVNDFNIWQRKQGRPDFRIGIGINYGIVTVGNIGSEKKMDYTVIGDMVNIASRLEGLTKMYKTELVISDSLFKEVGDKLYCRLLDKVIVKGKTEGVKIYTARKELTSSEKEAWEYHNSAQEMYFNRNFKGAIKNYLMVKEILPQDYISEIFIKRCEDYMISPPGEDWSGDIMMREK